MNNTPVQYQRGFCEFYKLRFKVTPDVLIPRPETELLVDEALEGAQKFRLLNSIFTILDIGTGSGNIAISIAKNLKLQTRFGKLNLRVYATDISEKALRVARQNAKLHGVEDGIEFIQSDLLNKIPQIPFDIIVTNLPYIPSYRIPYLDQSVKDFEPNIALDGGQDGFEPYRRLFQQTKDKNIHFRLLIGEIDYTQGELAREEALKYFPEAEVEIKFDLTKKQRILLIKQTAQAAS